MNEYKIKIIERLSTVVTVQADNIDDAENKVFSKYRDCEIVLTADDYLDTELRAISVNPIGENEINAAEIQ